MSDTDTARVPRHIAIVMDGNGRWAERRHRPRSFGHRAGQKAVREAVEFCLRNKVGTLTLFAFSSENWQRPVTEGQALMQLFLTALDKELDEIDRNGARIRFIGALDTFAPALRKRMLKAVERTAGNTALNLNVAVSYGGRWDITQATRALAAAALRGEIDPANIEEKDLAAHICLADLPPPDLFIRTGGEQRISNFLLWQLAYAELYFTDTLWPDVDQACLTLALQDFASRQRRFGRTGAQALSSTAPTPH